MKETFYFQHDYNSANDDKLLELRGKFGNEGYGVFWYCLETMASRGDGYIMPTLIGGLSLGYGVPKLWLQDFLDFCVSIKLFDKNEQGYFSQRMIDHLEFRKSLSVSGKSGADKRWGNSPPISTPNAKERKEKEIKEKKDIYGNLFENLSYNNKGIMFARINKYTKEFGEAPSQKQIDHWINTEIK